MNKERIKSKDKTERVKKKAKGLPPTAPSQRIPHLPQSNRNREVKDLNINSSELSSRNIQSRKGVRAHRGSQDGTKKKRKNPKTTEAAPLDPPKPNRYQMYRMHSREKQSDPIDSKR